MGGPAAALYDAIFAGGTYTDAGQTAELVLDLSPGEWIAWADDPEASQEPVIFEVTGEMPVDLAEPESSATITMAEYSITVTEGELRAGTQVVKIENVGAQPHFIVGIPGPDDLTLERLQVAIDEEVAAADTGTPPAYSNLNPEEDLSFEGGFFSGTQSQSTTVWVPVTLESGMYAMACFFPDLGDGREHVYHGMYTVVTVGTRARSRHQDVSERWGDGRPSPPSDRNSTRRFGRQWLHDRTSENTSGTTPMEMGTDWQHAGASTWWAGQPT